MSYHLLQALLHIAAEAAGIDGAAPADASLRDPVWHRLAIAFLVLTASLIVPAYSRALRALGRLILGLAIRVPLLRGLI